MTYRERLEARAERRAQWATSRRDQATALLQRNAPFRGDIAFNTQPGHIPERARAIAREDRASVHRAMADHHVSVATGIERQLRTSVFSDDDNALDALNYRITQNEAKRARMVQVNKLYKKGDAAGLAALGLTLETLRDQLKDAYAWEKLPYASYALTNLGARIRHDKARLADIQDRQARDAAANASPSGVVIKDLGGEGPYAYSLITFADKPERAILDALKAAGFRWSGGSWDGPTAAIPPSVHALTSETPPTPG